MRQGCPRSRLRLSEVVLMSPILQVVWGTGLSRSNCLLNWWWIILKGEWGTWVVVMRGGHQRPRLRPGGSLNIGITTQELIEHAPRGIIRGDTGLHLYCTLTDNNNTKTWGHAQSFCDAINTTSRTQLSNQISSDVMEHTTSIIICMIKPPGGIGKPGFLEKHV